MRVRIEIVIDGQEYQVKKDVSMYIKRILPDDYEEAKELSDGAYFQAGSSMKLRYEEHAYTDVFIKVKEE